MPGQPPPDGPDDRTVLYALPEDQPDRLSEGHKSNQADLDATPAEKAAGGKKSAAPKAEEPPAEDAPKPKARKKSSK